MTKYTVPTGEGYEGVYRVATGGVSVNMVTLGCERCEQITLYGLESDVVLVSRQADLSHPTIADRAINTSGYVELARPALRHLGVSDGDDVRVYRSDEHDGWEVVPASRDPHVNEAVDDTGVMG